MPIRDELCLSLDEDSVHQNLFGSSHEAEEEAQEVQTSASLTSLIDNSSHFNAISGHS